MSWCTICAPVWPSSVRRSSYRYAPVTPELDQLVDDTAAAFASSPSSVTEAILSAPSSSIRIFADAFKIKKD
jgi:hypothetical protein